MNRKKCSDETKKKISDSLLKFYNNNAGVKFGKTKEEHNIYYKKWRELNRDDYNKKRLDWANKDRERRTKQARKSHLKTTFNITLDDYDLMVKNQNGLGLICHKKPKKIKYKNKKNPDFHIDHDHKTGKIRGLLCYNCNIGLGKFNDDIEIMKSAINYLNNNNSIKNI